MLQQVTCLDALEVFLLNCEAKGLTKASFSFYRDKIKDFFLQSKVNQLSAINPTVIRQYLKSLQDKGLTSHSCHSHARAIRAFFNFCVAEDYLSVSPMKKVAMPKVRKLKPSILSELEIKHCLEACDCLRDKLLLLFSLDTGLRAMELVSLNFEHIQDGKVKVTGKGEKERHVFIGHKTKLLLAKYRLERHKPALTEPLFLSAKNDRLTVSGVMQFYKRLRQSTGIAKVTSHGIRRTALSMMLISGMSVFHLKEISGHEDIKTLMHYINVDSDVENAHSKYGVVDNL
jgi:site-specific recombinase XerD